MFSISLIEFKRHCKEQINSASEESCITEKLNNIKASTETDEMLAC